MTFSAFLIDFVAFKLRFTCFFRILHSISSGIIAPMLYPVLCVSLCDKERKLAHSHRFLSQQSIKQGGKCFLREGGGEGGREERNEGRKDT